MPTTPTWLLPYPTLTDTPDVPRDLQALAVAVDTGLGKVAAPKMTIVKRTGGQALAGGAATVVSFNTETLDELGGFDVATPTYVNAPVAGLYRVSYTFVADLASGTASVIVDPVAVTNMVETAVIGAGTGFGVSGSMPVNLAAGAHVQLSCFTSVAGSLSYCTLTLERLR